MQERGARDNFHGGYASGGINQRVNLDNSGDVLIFGERGIDRRNLGNQLGLFHVTANGKHCCRCGRLVASTDETSVQTFRACFRNAVVRQSDTGVGLSAILRTLAGSELGRGKMKVAKNRFLWLFGNRLSGGWRRGTSAAVGRTRIGLRI